MKRLVLRASGSQEEIEVGNDYREWNRTIGAGMGEIVNCKNSNLQLWVDEEGTLKKNPTPNLKAVLLCGREIVGDVIVFKRGDIK